MDGIFATKLRKTLWYLIGGTRGGVMRGRILNILKERPMNAHQLSKELEVDYKTALYHLRWLCKNKLLESEGEYGAVYLISDLLRANYSAFQEIWEKVGKKD